MNEEDILSEAFDTPFEELPKYQQNRANLNASRNIDPNRFQQQINNLPKPTIQDVSELAIDAKMAMETAKKVPGGPYIKAGAAVGGVVLRRVGKKTVKSILDSAFDPLRNKFTKPNFVKQGEAIFSGDLFRVTGGSFPTPQGAPFDEHVLKNYVNKAFKYRKARLAEKTAEGFSPKRIDLMKGFEETVPNKSGQEFILVRRRKVPNPDVREAIENYQLRSLWSVEDQLVKKRGFEFARGPRENELNKLKGELNRLKGQYPDRYYSSLMERGERAYLEHKVARGQSWFWRRKERDASFAPWVKAKNRNDLENLRLLFREPYKQVKDTTEMRLVARNNTIKNDLQKLVIDIEDPMSGDIFKRSNPGNLLIRRADTGEVVGLIGDFYQELYSEAFKKNFNLKKLRSDGVPPRYQAKPGETLTSYRDRVFNEKLDEAFKQELNHSALKEQSLAEMAEFFDTFDEQLGMIDTPDWVKKIQRNRFNDPAQLDIDQFNVKSLKAGEIASEVDQSLLKMVEDLEVAEKTTGKFGTYTDMEDPNLFEAAQQILEDFRAKTPKGEQGLIAEIGEENARSKLMQILFNKYGVK